MKNKMKGFEIDENGEGGVWWIADLKFFRSLAESRGRRPDRLFFKLLNETSDGGDLHSYEQPASWLGPCTLYGRGKAVDYYRRWNEFAEKFPNSYSKATMDNLVNASGVLTENLCACNVDTAPVINEIQLFIKTYPDTPTALKAKALLSAIHDGHSPIVLNCRPG